MRLFFTAFTILFFLFSSSLFGSYCPKDSYTLRVAKGNYALLTFNSDPEKKHRLEFDGCQRTYDMYDCYYSNSVYTLDDIIDNGLGGWGGYSITGCDLD